jgi:hypothetical protein
MQRQDHPFLPGAHVAVDGVLQLGIARTGLSPRWQSANWKPSQFGGYWYVHASSLCSAQDGTVGAVCLYER